MEDIGFIIQYAKAAISFRDDRIFFDFAAWLARILLARHVPSAVLEASLLAIASALDSTHPEMGALVRSGSRGAVLGVTFSGMPRPALLS